MKKLLIGSLVLIGMGAGAAAQSVEPTYKGDPGVYKIIFEDADYRIVESVRPKGVHDKIHSHPQMSAIYNVTDCKTKLYAADGKTTENESKAGTASALPMIPAHSAENVGSADCKQVFFEKK
jgi:hypothetical protein